MNSDYCDEGCSGYREDPKPGCLWPGETGSDFGYAHCLNATKVFLPAEVSAENTDTLPPAKGADDKEENYDYTRNNRSPEMKDSTVTNILLCCISIELMCIAIILGAK